MSDRQRLRDEVALREASLRDAELEHAAGELSDADLAAIRRREQDRLDAARAALAHATDAPVRPARRRRRGWLVVAGLAFAVALAGLLVATLAPRQPGNSITGSIALSPAQRVTALLTQAEIDVASGHVVDALAAYQQVLALAPTNVTALTQSGWLDFSAGSAKGDLTLVRRGETLLVRALRAAPANPAPRLYYALVAASTPGETALARREFALFLTLHPSKAQLAIARPFLARYHLSSGTG